MKKWIPFAMAALLFFSGMAQAEETAAPAKPDRLELILILDKSGSMYNLTSDTIGGFNSMIAKEKEERLPAHVTTVLFDNNTKELYRRRPIALVPQMTEKEYIPGGSTALLDAVGNTITTMHNIPAVRMSGTKVLVVIITDGLENASREYNKQTVRRIISDRQEEGWEFIYLGANIDAVKEAGDIGIGADSAVTYRNTASGVRANYAAIAEAASEKVKGGTGNRWREKVEKE